MPVYDHFCSDCQKVIEVMCRIEDRKQFVVCPYCKSMAERIISSQIRRDQPTWLDSAVDNLHDEAKHQVRDRSDFDRYLKRHGIVQRG